MDAVLELGRDLGLDLRRELGQTGEGSPTVTFLECRVAQEASEKKNHELQI